MLGRLGNEIKLGILIAMLSVLVVGFNACNKAFEASDLGGKGTFGSQTDKDPTDQNKDQDTDISIPDITVEKSADLVTAEMGTTHKISLRITNPANVDQAFDLKVDTPEIDVIDLLNGINITLSPATISVGPNSSEDIEVSIDIGTLSPSIAEHFHIGIYKQGTQLLVTESEIDLQVQAILRIAIFGEGDGNWYIGGKNLLELFPNAPAERPALNFIHHPQGIQVIFENYDTQRRRIHSSNAIQHQPGSLDPSADGVLLGESYVPAPVIGDSPINANVYLHGDENGGASRSLRFNVDL